MSFTSGVSASPGVLLALRDQLKFIEKGKEILEMKRDRLAGEINKLLDLVKLRREAEDLFMDAYKLFIHVLMRKGIRELESIAKGVNYMDIKFDTSMIMGINLVELKVDVPPNLDSIYDPLVQGLAKRFFEAFMSMLKAVVVENNIELLAKELMSTSRKVNSLEKIVIPEYASLIRYVEERLLEEALEEFVRTRYIIVQRHGEG
jgi:V/A-type H+-transporting ATPase subunit D